MGLSKPEVKNMGCVWCFLLLVLKYFLAYLGSSVKTTIYLARIRPLQKKFVGVNYANGA